MKLVLPRNSSASIHTIADQIRQHFAPSRFNVTVDVLTTRRINIGRVRLKVSKEYCGNHPNACEFNPGAKHRKNIYLEGADWVDFNDSLNNVLDYHSVEANVESSQVVLRKGRKRRINYDSDERIIGGFRRVWQWQKHGDPDDDYEDRCGDNAPAFSSFPMGTPGIHTGINYAVEG